MTAAAHSGSGEPHVYVVRYVDEDMHRPSPQPQQIHKARLLRAWSPADVVQQFALIASGSMRYRVLAVEPWMGGTPFPPVTLRSFDDYEYTAAPEAVRFQDFREPTLENALRSSHGL